MATTSIDDDEPIREHVESLAQALRARDIDALMAHYAPDVVTFDLRPPAGHSLSHIRSIRTSGEQADYWVRVTSGFRVVNGRWLIVHEHISMPIDMQTLQAVSSLQTNMAAPDTCRQPCIVTVP
jgi:ketosteroid isomerase-like protein